MRLLVIDTSGQACSIALFEDGIIIAERHEVIGRGHAEALIPWIANLPDDGRADEIIVGCGPGSFTGVRVGIAAARGLALAWEVPITGANSLALIAAPIANPAFLVAIEAGHGELYIQSFGTDPFRTDRPPISVRPENANPAWRALPAYGNGAERLFEAGNCSAASGGEPYAANMLLVPSAFRTLPPRAIYGRAPDARVSL